MKITELIIFRYQIYNKWVLAKRNIKFYNEDSNIGLDEGKRRGKGFYDNRRDRRTEWKD